MIDFGSTQTIETPRGSYTLDKLRLRQIREWRDHVAERLGDPFAEAERFVERLPREEAMKLLKEAEAVRDQLQAFSMFCPLSVRFLMTEEGLLWVARALLEKHHPQASEDDVEAVGEVLAGRLVEVLTRAMGSVPNGPGEQAPAPQSPSESTGGGSTRSPITATADGGSCRARSTS